MSCILVLAQEKKIRLCPTRTSISLFQDSTPIELRDDVTKIIKMR